MVEFTNMYTMAKDAATESSIMLMYIKAIMLIDISYNMQRNKKSKEKLFLSLSYFAGVRGVAIYFTK